MNYSGTLKTPFRQWARGNFPALAHAVWRMDAALTGGEESSPAARKMIGTLEHFFALGGNLRTMEHRIGARYGEVMPLPWGNWFGNKRGGEKNNLVLLADSGVGTLTDLEGLVGTTPQAPTEGAASLKNTAPAEDSASTNSSSPMDESVAAGGTPAAGPRSDAPGYEHSGEFRDDPSLPPSVKEGEQDESSWLDDNKRALGLGTRDVLGGTLGFMDNISVLSRSLLNGINGLLGGDPEYFKPLAEVIPDALNLPRPETDTENLISNINASLTEVPLMIWGGVALLAQKSVGALPGVPRLSQVAGEALAAGPAEQALNSAASGAAVGAAQNAGWGPLGQFVAGILGGVATPGSGKGTPHRVTDAAENALEHGPHGAAGNAGKAGAAGEHGVEAKAGFNELEGNTVGATGTETCVADGQPAKAVKGKKPDPHALTRESMDAALAKSLYADKAGSVMEIDHKELGFSQTSVSYSKRRDLPDGSKLEYTYDDIKKDLFENGWPKNEPIDVVIMPPDGKLTSMDNTRLAALNELGGVDKHGNPMGNHPLFSSCSK